MIYLASPYSIGADASLRQLRYEYNLKVLAELTLKGEVVFSPIVHSHPLSLAYKFPETFDFWAKIDYAFLDLAEKLYVIMLPGWIESHGVGCEIEYMKKLGKPISYLPVKELKVA